MDKKFHISDILSVTTGATLSNRHMGGIYDIMGHLVNDKEITTGGLAAMRPKAQEFLEAAMPWVKEVEFPSLSDDASLEERVRLVNEFLNVAAKKYGEFHEVPQMEDAPKQSLENDLAYAIKVRGEDAPLPAL